MRYAYMLSDYQEDGAENIHITLDRSLVLQMFQDGWPEYDSERLKDVLETKSDKELSVQQSWVENEISDGWGGPRLNVVKIYGD